MKNEAELTSKIDQVLSIAFPTFEKVNLTHQKSFSIKFGHHNVLIDNREPTNYASRAIYDILLTVGETHCILLELKREGLELTSDDIEQGLSYARLIHPMPPVTLISNGKGNLFYNTFTKAKIDTETIDFDLIKNLIQNSFQLATNDLKDAVNLLLNKDPKLFASAINSISQNKFITKTGEIGEFSKPICADFIIPLSLVDKIYDSFSKEQELLGIIGPAFSGKTNILYQFYEKFSKKENHFVLYLDVSDYNYSLLQQLANSFAATFNNAVTKDKIREWLIIALSTKSDFKFFLLLDNLSNDIHAEIRSEIVELIDIFKGTNHRILFTTDEFNYTRLALVEHRTYRTVFGEGTKIFELDELTDEEYEKANLLLFEKFRASIELGGHSTADYRKLRILRNLAYLYDARGETEGKYVKIPAIPNLDLLNAFASNKTYPKSANSLYKKLAYCFHHEAKVRGNNSDINLIASGSGAITLNSFKKHFPEYLEELINSSLVVLRDNKDDTKLIIPKVPELLAVHSINIVSQSLVTYPKPKNTSQITKFFIETITPLPYSDIVGCGVLLALGRQNHIELFSKIIIELLKMPPKIVKIQAGTKAKMYIEDIGHVTFNFEDDYDEGSFISDPLPFTVLSQLAFYPLKIQDPVGFSEYAFHLTMLRDLGSFPHTIRRVDSERFENMKPISTHELEGIGSLVHGEEGIVEPLVQAIQKIFHELPQEIEKLFIDAISNNKILLAWRVYLAIRSLTSITDNALADKAQEFKDNFKPYFHKFMTEYLAKSITDPEERLQFIKSFPEVEV